MSRARKLTEADARQIRRMCESGIQSDASIGKMFGVSYQQVWKIRTNKNWTHTATPENFLPASSISGAIETA